MNSSTIAAYNKFGGVYDEEVEKFWNEFPETTLDGFTSLLRGNKILNLGSGSGRDAILLRERNLDITCIDASVTMVEMTRKLGFKSIMVDFLKLELPPYSFDGVWAYTSLLHIKKTELKKVVGNIHSWLKKDGVFLLGMIEGSFEGMADQVSMPGTKRYFRYYTDEELEKIMLAGGFKKIFQEKYIPSSKTYLSQVYIPNIKDKPVYPT